MVDTQQLKDTLQQELDWLAKTRDELRLQIRLARSDTRSELNRLEQTWQRVQDEIRRVGAGPASELASSARGLLEELKGGYERIRRQLDDSGLPEMITQALPTADSVARLRHAEERALLDAERAAVDSPAVRILDRLAARISGHADARAVFAPPVTRDGVTVIPVARVVGGFGAGAGTNRADGTPHDGGGGAGGFAAVPVGFIEITHEGARFRPLDSSLDSWFSFAEWGFRWARQGVSGLRAFMAKRRRKV